MRKITREICQAFIDGRSRIIANSETDGTHLWLHGNLIAAKHGEAIAMSLAGWNTPTTRERLNGLCELAGCGRPWFQRAWEPHFAGIGEIESTDTVAVNLQAGYTLHVRQRLHAFLWSRP